MLKNLYVLIIIIIPIVQIIMCKTIHNSPLVEQEQDQGAQDTAKSVKKSDSKKSRTVCEQVTDPRYFDSVIEMSTKITTSKRNSIFSTMEVPALKLKAEKSFGKPDTLYTQPVSEKLYVQPDKLFEKSNKADDKTYEEIKSLLSKVLEQLEEIEKKRDDENTGLSPLKAGAHNSGMTEMGFSPSGLLLNKGLKKKKKEDDSRPKRMRWGHWTDWSSCSVSCGKGRQIRWRHCVENCNEAETEMEEKTCQLPACGPGKLFGVIKL